MHFKIGDLYSHATIIKELKVGNSGGIRVAAPKKSKVDRVVLFSTSEQEYNPQENPYNDSTDGAILTYTGTGKIGDQNLSGPNLRIIEQTTKFFPIYVFSLLSHRKSSGSPEKRWRFAGIYKYLDHSCENQSDLLGVDRSAWIFKLLRLEINQASLATEDLILKQIAVAYTDPLYSAKSLLGKSASYSAEEIKKTVTKLNSLAPFDFEVFLKNTLIASQFREVRVTKKSADGGIDVIARMPFSIWPIDNQIIQIQAKRWIQPVGRREVAELRGSLYPRAIGVIVTTGNYAKTAITEAERPNVLPVSLIDGHKLASVVMRLNMIIN